MTRIPAEEHLALLSTTTIAVSRMSAAASFTIGERYIVHIQVGYKGELFESRPRMGDA